MRLFLTVIAIGLLVVSLLGCGGGGSSASSSPAPAVQTVPRVSLPNANQTIRVGDAITYDASQSGRTFTDADRDTLSYSVTYEPDSLGLSASGALISGTAALEGIVTAIITVRDTDGNTVEDRFDITVVPRQIERVFVTQEQGIINIFVKGTTEPSEQYLRYRFEQFNTPANRAQGWGWRALHEATMTSFSNFTISNSLLTGGENILAIREVGKSDFMGGRIHGDAIDSRFIMRIDGEERAIDGRTAYQGLRIKFEQDTTLYEVDVEADIETAKVQTIFSIEFESAVLSDRVAFTRPIELSSAFLAMLSTERQLDTGSLAVITTEGAYSPDFTPIDVSRERHGAATSMGPDEVRLRGPTGYHFSVKMVDGWDDPLRRSYISGDPAYNKIYFSPIGLFKSTGPGLNVPAGYVIETTAEYRLDTTN